MIVNCYGRWNGTNFTNFYLIYECLGMGIFSSSPTRLKKVFLAPGENQVTFLMLYDWESHPNMTGFDSESDGASHVNVCEVETKKNIHSWNSCFWTSQWRVWESCIVEIKPPLPWLEFFGSFFLTPLISKSDWGANYLGSDVEERWTATFDYTNRSDKPFTDNLFEVCFL